MKQFEIEKESERNQIVNWIGLVGIYLGSKVIYYIQETHFLIEWS